MYKDKYPDIRTAQKYKRNKRLRYLNTNGISDSFGQLQDIILYSRLLSMSIRSMFMDTFVSERFRITDGIQKIMEASGGDFAKALKQTYQAL